MGIKEKKVLDIRGLCLKKFGTEEVNKLICMPIEQKDIIKLVIPILQEGD